MGPLEGQFRSGVLEMLVGRSFGYAQCFSDAREGGIELDPEEKGVALTGREGTKEATIRCLSIG